MKKAHERKRVKNSCRLAKPADLERRYCLYTHTVYGYIVCRLNVVESAIFQTLTRYSACIITHKSLKKKRAVVLVGSSIIIQIHKSATIPAKVVSHSHRYFLLTTSTKRRRSIGMFITWSDKSLNTFLRPHQVSNVWFRTIHFTSHSNLSFGRIGDDVDIVQIEREFAFFGSDPTRSRHVVKSRQPNVTVNHVERHRALSSRVPS